LPNWSKWCDSLGYSYNGLVNSTGFYLDDWVDKGFGITAKVKNCVCM